MSTAIKSVILGLLCASGLQAQDIRPQITSVSEDESQLALKFLKDNMPGADKQKISADYLAKNVELALKARSEFSWAQKVPQDVFLNDVLPYASLDERRDDWREDFYKRFKALVKPAKNQSEAIGLINKAIKDELGVAYSTARKKANQSPYESMESGIASCSGLSILLTNAFRSVGIPARIAGTPSWTTKRGNHNWVEVWTTEDQAWHFTEYYPDGKGIDHAWFSADAAKADATKPMNRIYATSWQPTNIHFPMVWDMKSKQVHGVDVTSRYQKPEEVDLTKVELRIDALSDGDRIAVPVEIYQGDKLVFSGSTPGKTADMNQFLTFSVKLTAESQLRWLDSQSKPQVLDLSEKNDQAIQRISLKY